MLQTDLPVVIEELLYFCSFFFINIQTQSLVENCKQTTKPAPGYLICTLSDRPGSWGIFHLWGYSIERVKLNSGIGHKEACSQPCDTILSVLCQTGLAVGEYFIFEGMALRGLS